MNFQLLAIRKLRQDACQRLMLSLYHCLQNYHHLSRIQPLDTKKPIARLGKGDFLGICHLLSIQQMLVLFQLHVCMVSHMQVLATPSPPADTAHQYKDGKGSSFMQGKKLVPMVKSVGGKPLPPSTWVL